MRATNLVVSGFVDAGLELACEEETPSLFCVNSLLASYWQGAIWQLYPAVRVSRLRGFSCIYRAAGCFGLAAYFSSGNGLDQPAP